MRERAQCNRVPLGTDDRESERALTTQRVQRAGIDTHESERASTDEENRGFRDEAKHHTDRHTYYYHRGY